MNEQYYPNKVRPMVQLIASLIEKNPEQAKDRDWLMASVASSIPAVRDPKHCPNCGASMAMRIIKLDVNVALLLYSMGKIVLATQEQGFDFTTANKVHVSSNPSITHTSQCQTTKAAKLGLIAKAGHGTWSVTTRGWEALRGERVPSVRVTFRTKIIERPEPLTTLSDIFAAHAEKMQTLRLRGRVPKDDHTLEFQDYRPRAFSATR